MGHEAVDELLPTARHRLHGNGLHTSSHGIYKAPSDRCESCGRQLVVTICVCCA